MVRTQSQEKKEKFLNAALKLFASNGVGNTSTAEISRQAGAGAGTLFIYFPTKQDLIHELVLKIAQEQSDTVKSGLEPSLSARETFFVIWTRSVRWFLENMDAYQYIQQIRDAGVVADAVVQKTAEYLSFYYVAIQKGLQEDTIKREPIELIGSFLYHDIVAITNIVRGKTDPAQQDELIRMGFDLFWDGIKRQS